jgi:HK97 family phage major capsid protein
MNSDYWFKLRYAELAAADKRIENGAPPPATPRRQTTLEARLQSAQRMRERLANDEITIDEFRSQLAVIGRAAALEVRERAPDPKDDDDVTKTYDQDEVDALLRTQRDKGKAKKARKNWAKDTRAKGVPEIQGTPGESLVPGQSVREYVRRAAENGVTTVRETGMAPERIVNHDQQYLNDWWAHRLGISSRESRSLSEDTSGSGLAITPQAWSSSVIDFLYANAVVGQLGATVVPLPTELYNKPVLANPAQPAWLAENSAIGLDANPAFSTIQFNSQGGWKDLTSFSIELAQDAFVAGTLPDLLAESVARNMALAVDAAAINGVSGNSGNPGLNAETGFNARHYTGDAGTSGKAPVDTTEYSVIAELVKNKNSRVSAFLQNPSVTGTVSRLNASSVARYWNMPDDVKGVPIVETTNPNVLPTTETSPSTASGAALTGGTFSSVYAGFWPFMMLGTHLSLQTTVLKERLIDLGQVGLFAFARYSIRTAHPETFYRTVGWITT